MAIPTHLKNLSDTVLSLKFMKKTKLKILDQQDQEERRLMYAKEIEAIGNEEKCRVEKVGSYFDVSSYLPCRLSFGGMEPTIEKLNEDKMIDLYEKQQVEVVKPVMEADVTEEEMAETFCKDKNFFQRKKRKRRNHGQGSKKRNRTQ